MSAPDSTGLEQRILERLAPHLLLIAATAAMADVVRSVAGHTIEVVRVRHLLPRWDLATHLGHGWLDYHLLATGQIHRLFWDLWLQGYWPPVLSLYQIPFYVVLGSGITSGLWSTMIAFVLIGVTGSVVLWRQWRYEALLPASLFLALLMSSPFLLAYASVTMTEIPGALAQVLVVLCYARYRQHPGARTAHLLAASLSLLFFTKYNYFFLMAGPLVLHEWLERTSGLGATGKLTGLWHWTRRVVTSPTGALVILYFIGVLLVVRSGGFDVQLGGRRVSVHTVGNSGYVVLYGLLARVWYLHRRGRIDWAALAAADPRMRPVLLWLVAPVTIWLASPYPNHIRDFASLVINRPYGEAAVGSGLMTYVVAMRTSFFFNDWLLAFVVVAFGVAAVRYRRQPPWMQCLVLAIPLQFAALVIHPTQFTRFLLLSVVLLCLAASAEAGRWFARVRAGGLVAVLVSPIVLVSGMAAARAAVEQERFRTLAFENYSDSEPLRVALASIRAELTAGDRLAIVGQSNDLSPALFRWELGPPSGVPCFPSTIGGAARLDLPLATRVLLLVPLEDDATTLDLPGYYLSQRRAVLEHVERGELVLRREMPLADLHVSMQVYDRTSAPASNAPCR